jgi:hypothetical protein
MTDALPMRATTPKPLPDIAEAASPAGRYRVVPGSASAFLWHVIDTADNNRTVGFYRTRARADAGAGTWNQRGAAFVTGAKDTQ